MKQILTLTILFFASTVFGQQMTLEQWNEEARTNIRLLPKYGHVKKTEELKRLDKEFIERALKEDTTNRKASNRLIRIGFNYIYEDIKKAMYRFNQAYLLDSTNTDIYWGFGGVYMTLGDYEKAEQQYKEGLSLNPNNTHLLTDYGTCFMAQYLALQLIDEEKALIYLEKAITNILQSYKLNPTDQNTIFKLSVCYWNKGDCDNAWKYYNIFKELGGRLISEAYIEELKKKCKQKE